MPSSVQTRPPAPTDFGWALSSVLRAYVRAADQVLDDLPGGARAYRLLVSAARSQQPSQLALAAHVGLDRTVVTYLLDDLCAAGLVQRRPDPADRRARIIVVTEAGAQRLADFERRLQEVESQVLGALDASEAAQLRDLLSRVAERLRDGGSFCAEVASLGAAPEPGCPTSC